MTTDGVPPTWSAERPRTVVVDGHGFRVRPRPAEPGTYDIDWTTGPNEGYGFSSAGGPLTTTGIEEGIRDFLGGVDPRAGDH